MLPTTMSGHVGISWLVWDWFAGSSLMLDAISVAAMAPSEMMLQLQGQQSERILVLIQLEGGNDGLNTIIPVEDGHYYRARPRLAIPKRVALPLSPTLGIHPALGQLANMYSDGQVSIVQSVGYPSSSLSHFQGTDVWVSANDPSARTQSGWSGRQLETEYRDFVNNPTHYPLAVQIGGLSSGLFQGKGRNMGMSLANSASFDRLARTGRYFREGNIPDVAYGRELKYLRSVANDAFRYGEAIFAAAADGRNEANYPGGGNNNLAGKLAIVARLVKGDLGARVYHVSLNGFDTHGTQGATLGRHASLLRQLARGGTIIPGGSSTWWEGEGCPGYDVFRVRKAGRGERVTRDRSWHGSTHVSIWSECEGRTVWGVAFAYRPRQER